MAIPLFTHEGPPQPPKRNTSSIVPRLLPTGLSYVVLSFGGLLGIGDDHYPLRWQALKYDTTLAATSSASRRINSAAPQYADESSWNWSDPATTRSVNAYYGVPVA